MPCRSATGRAKRWPSQLHAPPGARNTWRPALAAALAGRRCRAGRRATRRMQLAADVDHAEQGAAAAVRQPVRRRAMRRDRVDHRASAAPAIRAPMRNTSAALSAARARGGSAGAAVRGPLVAVAVARPGAAGCAGPRRHTPRNCGSGSCRASLGQLWSPGTPIRFQQSSHGRRRRCRGARHAAVALPACVQRRARRAG